MRVRLCTVLIVTAMFGGWLSARGQSRAELRNKYGSPVETYEVRPDILLTVKYSKDDQPTEYLIEPRCNTRDTMFKQSLMSEKLVGDLIDEIVPLSQRGERGRSISLTSSCNVINVASYERVEIQTVSTCPSREGHRITKVVIRIGKSTPEEFR